MQISDTKDNQNGPKFEKRELGNSKVEYIITIPNDQFENAKTLASERLSKTVKIPGFRPGKAPSKTIEAYLGAQPYEEALNNLLPKYTVQVLQLDKTTPIDQIQYKVLEVNKEIGVKFSASFTVYPVIKIGDLKRIKVTKAKSEVNDKEVEDVLANMYKESEQKSKVQKDEKQDVTKGGIVVPKGTIDQDQKKGPTDEWVKGLGLGVSNLKELKEKVKQELLRQKEQVNMDKYVTEILAEIAKDARIEAPQSFVDEEVSHREQDYKKRIENLGMKVDEFLEKQNVSLDDLRKKWQEESSEKIKNELILFQLIKDYSIEVKSEEIDREISLIQDPKLKEQLASENGKRYIQNVMLQQKAIRKMLEEVEKK